MSDSARDKAKIELYEEWTNSGSSDFVQWLADKMIDTVAAGRVSLDPAGTGDAPGKEKCGEPAASFIPRWGMSFACALPKGHTGDHQQGGNCFAHGEYIGKQCPQWPSCVNNILRNNDTE